MYSQIKKSAVISSARWGANTSAVQKRYDNAVKNNRQFNRGICTFKKIKSANGDMLKIYLKGKLVRELYCLGDKMGLEFGYVDYDGKGI